MVRVVVFGTFDKLHKGHISFLKQAKGLGDFLLVVVARDKFVKKAKGTKPTFGEKVRLRRLRNIRIADKAVLGSRTYDFPRTIRTHRIGMVALGYDQKPKIVELRKNLRKRRLKGVKIVRLKPFKTGIYKSSKIVKGYD